VKKKILDTAGDCSGFCGAVTKGKGKVTQGTGGGRWQLADVLDRSGETTYRNTWEDTARSQRVREKNEKFRNKNSFLLWVGEGSVRQVVGVSVRRDLLQRRLRRKTTRREERGEKSIIMGGKNIEIKVEEGEMEYGFNAEFTRKGDPFAA